MAVTRYGIINREKTGVFRPGQKIRVGAVTVVNDGDLTLPAGALVMFPENRFFTAGRVVGSVPPGSTGSIAPGGRAFKLPALRPREKFAIPVKWEVMVKPAPQVGAVSAVPETRSQIS